MATDSAQIVQKLWNYCNVLRDDGMSYGDWPFGEAQDRRRGVDEEPHIGNGWQ